MSDVNLSQTFFFRTSRGRKSIQWSADPGSPAKWSLKWSGHVQTRRNYQ